MKAFCVGDKNEKLVKLLRKSKIQREIVIDFYRKLCTAHIAAAVYIQKKYALNIPLLSAISAIDSQLRQKFSSHEQLLNLKPYFESFLKDSLSKCGM